MLDNVASPAFRQKRSKLAPTSCQASSMFAAGTTAVNVVGLFMALLSFRGIRHPEPTGSRRATPASHFQHSAGQRPTAVDAGVALTEGMYRHAAELFGQAAEYVPAGHSDERSGYLSGQASALCRQGDERGDNDALRRSVEIYRLILEGQGRERVPLDWATAQNNLGAALRTLGERESGTARLEEAVSAYRAALEERTRDRVPLDWAMTQNNLGNALYRLGEREGGTARLEEAVSAYRAALEEWTSEVAPHWHDLAEQNMARCLALVGQRRKSRGTQAENLGVLRDRRLAGLDPKRAVGRTRLCKRCPRCRNQHIWNS